MRDESSKMVKLKNWGLETENWRLADLYDDLWKISRFFASRAS